MISVSLRGSASRQDCRTSAICFGGSCRPDFRVNLIGYREAERSLIGIAILLAAAFAMPFLARQKRKLAAVTFSANLNAAAAESALCGYMAWIALAGLAVNELCGLPWADPLAALVLTPVIVREGRETLKLQRMCCRCSD